MPCAQNTKMIPYEAAEQLYFTNKKNYNVHYRRRKSNGVKLKLKGKFNDF